MMDSIFYFTFEWNLYFNPAAYQNIRFVRERYFKLNSDSIGCGSGFPAAKKLPNRYNCRIVAGKPLPVRPFATINWTQQIIRFYAILPGFGYEKIEKKVLTPALKS
jgi:hypothetical protein